MPTKTILSVNASPSNEQSYTSPGTYSFVVPAGVTSVSAVLVGAGGGGVNTSSGGGGGGGGGLRYINNLTVTPGETLTVEVGTGGIAGTSVAGATDGGNTILKRNTTTLVEAGGGKKPISQLVSGLGGTGSTITGNIGGGNGGDGGVGATAVGGGGGGAGGYTGPGGTGGTFVSGSTTSGGPGLDGTGGGGGGGGAGGSGDTGGGGGGVGLFGLGANGVGGAGGGTGDAFAGTDGSSGLPTTSAILLGGGAYGGGGPGGDSSTSLYNGGSGAVRIIWGDQRLFPSSNVNTQSASAGGFGNFTAKKIHVRDAGQWRRAKNAWVRQNNVWEKVYTENVQLTGAQSLAGCYSAQGGFSVDLYQGNFVLTMGAWPNGSPNCGTADRYWLRFGGTDLGNGFDFVRSTNGAYASLLNTYGVWYNDTNSTTQFDQTVTVNFPTTGNYTFSALADNDCTIVLDGTTIITNTSYTTVSTNTRSVTADNRTIRIIANNSGGQGSVGLEIKRVSDNQVIYSTLDFSQNARGNEFRRSTGYRYWEFVWTLNIDNMTTGQTIETRAEAWPYNLVAYTYRVTKVSNTSIRIVPYPEPWGTGDTGTSISVNNWWNNVAALGGGGTSQVQTGTDSEGNPVYTTVYNPGQINLSWTF